MVENHTEVKAKLEAEIRALQGEVSNGQAQVLAAQSEAKHAVEDRKQLEVRVKRNSLNPNPNADPNPNYRPISRISRHSRLKGRSRLSL